MLYETVTAAHIISLIVWIAGMTVVAVTLRHPSPESLKSVKTFDRRITTPAMLLTWCFGIYLAVQGGWFGETWMLIKIVFVVILSGLHGMLTGRLRLIAWNSSGRPDGAAKLALPFGFGLVVAVVLLVMTKAL